MSSQSGDSVYTDLLTFAFRGRVAYQDNRPLVIDAEDPSRALTAGQFRLLVRTLIAGLQAHHVQRGECVLVHLGNSVSVSLSLSLCPPHPSPYIPQSTLEIVTPKLSRNSGWQLKKNIINKTTDRPPM